MHATQVILPGIVEPDGLRIVEVELPTPGPDQALVAVEASGVSFAEQQMRRGKYYDQPRFPFVPGYDLVGRVLQGPAHLVGRRVAAMTKTGGWSTHVVIDADDLVPVPDGVDPVQASTLVVNGLTAWAMAHSVAKVRVGQTVLVHGANGGVGTVLAQLAIAAGARVIGTASERNHDALRELGIEPVDYRSDIERQVRELAPEGVDAVFDHVGGSGINASHRLLKRGGSLVSYGTAATKNDKGNSQLPVLRLIAKLAWWNYRPGGHRASFFNVWQGHRNRARFQARVRQDLGQVFELLASGQLRTHVAATFPLEEASRALELAESRTVVGKVVLVPRSHG